MSDNRSLFLNLYVTAVTLVGVAAFVLAIQFDPFAGSELQVSFPGFITFVVLGLGLELAGHKLATGGAGGSIAFVVFLAASLVFGPTWGAAITGISVGGAQLLNRRPPTRVVFNVAQHATALIAGAFVYVWLGGEAPPFSFGASLPPFVGMVFAFLLINSAAVSVAVAVSQGKDFIEVWTQNTLNLAIYDVVASLLGLGIAWMYVTSGLIAMAAVVAPILFVRHIYTVNLQLQTTNRELLELMVKAIEARDPYTSGHSQRVAELARAIAKDSKLSFREIEQIATAALLHDVGKIYEEFAPILRKEGRLTEEEMRIMRTHSIRSADLVGTMSSLRGQVYKSVRHHHEDYDGSGYPDGLSGMQIPFGARIIRIADTVDAMTTDRPYRKALSFERVVEELGAFSGRQFDPALITVFMRGTAIRRVIERRRPSGEQSITKSAEIVEASARGARSVVLSS